MLDGDILRAVIDVAMCLRRADEVIADPAVMSKLDGITAGSGGRSIGPTRAQLMEVIG